MRRIVASMLVPSRVVRSGACVLLLAVGCTNDFSRFRFNDAAGAGGHPSPPRDSGMDSSAGSLGGRGGGGSPSDAGDSNTPDPDTGTSPNMRDGEMPGQPDGEIPDADLPPTDAGMPPIDGGEEDSGKPEPPDAGTPQPDAGIDAGSTETSQCETATEEWSSIPISCRQCACNECATPTLACLELNPNARDLCTMVWECGLRSGCSAWNCYCRGLQCSNNPTLPPDGPCAEQLTNAATFTEDSGGETPPPPREAVRAAVNLLKSDPTSQNPAVVAMRALSCALTLENEPPDAGVGPCHADCAPSPR